jgi:AhpD family alkylhydroperoxidase
VASYEKVRAWRLSYSPQKYREVIAVATAAAMKCPTARPFHKDVAKMYGATEAELNELAVIVAQTSFFGVPFHSHTKL